MSTSRVVAVGAVAALTGATQADILAINTGDGWANNALIAAIGAGNVDIIEPGDIASVDFSLYDGLYVTDAFSNASTPFWASELIARAADIEAYINAGGWVIVGVEAFGGDSTTNGDEYNFLPAGLVDGQTVGTQVFGNDVVITDPSHPLFNGLTNADLSNWGSSYHGSVPVGTLPVLATNNAGTPLIRGGEVGDGGVVVWTLDPDFHFTPGGIQLVDNAIALIPSPATGALLALGGLMLSYRRRPGLAAGHFGDARTPAGAGRAIPLSHTLTGDGRVGRPCSS